MTIYGGPVFEMARDQFGTIADYIEIPEDERDPPALPQARHDRLLPHPPR